MVTPAPAAEATPAPDPLAWLAEHRSAWPREIVLQDAFEFPAVSQGRVAGSLMVPAGTKVGLIEWERDELLVEHLGGRRRVPLAKTDLRARAVAAMAEAARDRARLAALPAAAPELSPEMIREASEEEIRRGLGAHYTRAATSFRLFAPRAKEVSVVLYAQATGEEGRTVIPLRRQANDLWEGTVKGDLQGRYYNFLLEGNAGDSTREVLDPYAVSTVADSSRARITPLTRPVPRGPRLASPTDAVIYEMHVRDFTVAPSSGVERAGLYLGWTEGGTRLPGDETITTALDHLVELGVTHVQLMPVHDFENDESARGYNWGYITSAFFSPEGMFATDPDNGSRVRELKALIAALHERGIGVILDVVYNHTSGRASLLQIAPEHYYRHWPDGSLADGAACGNEVRSEAPMTRRLILDSLKFWVTEYGVDGFRFDLMALLDQETMKQAGRELRALNPDILLYGEPWLAKETPLRSRTDKGALKQVPVGAFNDDFRNALKGLPDGGEPGWIQNGTRVEELKKAMLVSDWFASPAQSINYMTCHDNLVLWDKLGQSMPGAGEDLKIATMKLGYLALFTSQGVPFFHGGEEFARTKGGHHNSYEAPDSVNQVDWERKREYSDLNKWVRDLIALRKAHPLFRLQTTAQVRSRVQFQRVPDERVLMYAINGSGLPGEEWKRVCVILNSASDEEIEVRLPAGEWRVALEPTTPAGSVFGEPDGAAAKAAITSESGAASRRVSGKLLLPRKSGIVLYQR